MSDQETEQPVGGFSSTPTTGNYRGTIVRHPLKKRPPSSYTNSLGEPTAKKLTLGPSSPPDHHLRGFTRLPLPFNFQRPTPTRQPRRSNSPENPNISLPISQILRRAISDVISPGFQEAVKEQAALPPIRRAVSDVVSPGFQDALVETTTASQPAREAPVTASRRLSWSSNPYFKALQRMKEMIKGISEHCEEVINETEEEEEEKDGSEDTHPQGGKEGEAMSLERSGEGMTIGFKCKCGKDYQLLISGNKCYYLLG